ncbi:DUF1642 domain-containing protein [Enterococcus faecium]|uniref:DUF1642 domain-containing protein n=1 Tax=Enterococcus faecium TaxID=1352 RepID=UPI0002A1B186|nr:hypothetical protein OIU_03072 [Enterococcus faecium EnGen0039]MBE5025960.1 DUF1642 domain-containing protein [Enterococcus faecium]
MDELITKVEQWAKDKGLDHADPKAQFLKVAEEFGEIASAMARSNDELFKDSVGDVIVTLIILSMQKGTNVQECLEMAYNEIKRRTGKMVDGVFVKSSDLEDSDESKITDEQAWNKVAEAYPESAQSLRNTLDNAVFGKTGEHQKPVVPKFVAEWFEDNKDDLEFAIWELCVDSYGSAQQGMLDWIQQSENNPIETLVRMKDGYEVEKVPKYIVKIGKLYLKEPLGDTSNSTILTTWDKKRAYPFSSFHTADKHADKFEGAVVEVAEG